MITEGDITKELGVLNEIACDYGRNYEYKKGENEGKTIWGLFDVHDNNYKPIYCAGTSAGFFAYISLLKNLYKSGKIPGKNDE